MDLTEAVGIKKRWQEYTEELNKKDLHDTDNLEGVITPRARHPGMQSQVTLGSITRNKASGGDGIPVELLQILKDDAVKVPHQYANKSGKLSSGHRTGNGQFSFQSQRGNSKECSNYCTIALISHPSKVMLKILQARLQ